MQLSPKISVIVPVYNIQDYIRQCIESVLCQTYTSLELILVDDGSTDNSGKICEEYAQRDSRVVIIHKTNGGQSSARNMGIDIARGEWLSFVDGDDWIEPEMYQKMLSVVRPQDDIVCCSHYDVYGSGKYPAAEPDSMITRYTNNQIFNELFGSNHMIRFEAWNKLFRRTVVNNIRFKEGQLYEEVFFDRFVFSKCRQCVCLNMPFYNYRRNRDGSTATFFNEKKMYIFEELINFSEDLYERGCIMASKACLKYGFETALTFYIQAKQLNGSRYLLKCIDKYVKQLWGICNGLPIRLKCQYFVYLISPEFYCYVKGILYKRIK